MLLCKGLAEKLKNFAEASHTDVNTIFDQILYEIPDEALEEYAALEDPVDVDISPELEAVANDMAGAFGMTPLGMSVLMNKIIDRAIIVNRRREQALVDLANNAIR